MVPKHVGLLQISGKEFHMEAIPLRTVRQLYMDNVILADHIDQKAPTAKEKSEKYCIRKVQELIAKAGEFCIWYTDQFLECSQVTCVM